jgi:hypothetical protein
MSSYTPEQYAGWRDELLHRPYEVFSPDRAIAALTDVFDGDAVLAYGLVLDHLRSHGPQPWEDQGEPLLDTTDLARLMHQECEVLRDPYGDGDEVVDAEQSDRAVGEVSGYTAGFGQQQLPGWFQAVEPTMCGAEEPVPYELTEDALLALAADGHAGEMDGPGHCLAASHPAEADEAVLE